MSDRIKGAARRGVGRLQDAVGGLTGDGTTQINGKLNEAAGALQSAYGQAAEQAQKTLEQTRGKAEHTYSDLDRYLRDRPLTGVGIGIGIGLLLAHVLGGGRKTVYIRERPRDA
jgi:uncharacterized protein YjbJ (UPF0337 family)